MPATAAPPTAPIETPQNPAAGSPMSDAYADLDRMMGESPSIEPASPESSATDVEEPSAGKPSTSKPDKAKPASSVPDAGLKKPDQPKPTDPSKPKPQPAAELRQAYEALKAKHKALEAEHAALRAKPPEDPEKKSIQERYEAAEKRRADLENEIKFARYESSEEYKQKYEQPFVDAYQLGRAKTADLDVALEDGTTRPATEADFDAIARIVSNRDAVKLAKQMFGDEYTIPIYHRERVQELNGTRVKAIEDFRKQGSERERQWNEQQSKTRESVGKLWQQSNQEAVDKYPQWFKPTEGADDENAALEDGFKLADKGFSDAPDLSPEQRVRLHSAIRNRAAGFGRVVLQNRKLSSKVAELEEKLKQFQSSEPGAGDGKGQQKAEQDATLDSVLSSLDTLAR